MVVNRICLVEFHRPTFKIQTFSEIIGALFTAFNQLGIEVRYRQNQIDESATNIIFGGHRVFHFVENMGPPPGNCIFFNLEKLNKESNKPYHLRYLNLLKRALVIDYSDKNCKLLLNEGNDKVHRFRFGYTSLTPFKFPSRGNHLLFYGLLNPRRKTIIDSLSKNATRLLCLDDSWGFERDYEISTSGAVLNICKEDNSIVEIYRLWHSLCLSTPVISEKGVDPVLVDEWKDYVNFIDSPQQISAETLSWVPNADLYRAQTSFHAETVKLKKWIENLT